jgi:hypothetical protein
LHVFTFCCALLLDDLMVPQRAVDCCQLTQLQLLVLVGGIVHGGQQLCHHVRSLQSKHATAAAPLT